MEKDFGGMSAQEITQLLRGRIFILADSILTSSKTVDLGNETYPLILSFLNAVIRMIVQWLQNFPKYLPYVIN